MTLNSDVLYSASMTNVYWKSIYSVLIKLYSVNTPKDFFQGELTKLKCTLKWQIADIYFILEMQKSKNRELFKQFKISMKSESTEFFSASSNHLVQQWHA